MPQCLVYSTEVVNGEVASFQTGKINMSDGFQDWSCSSSCSPPSHCHLPRCTKVSFRETFSGSKKTSLTIAWVSNWGEIDTSRCVRGISSHKEPHSQKEHNKLYKIPKFAVYRANVRSTRRLSGTCPDLEILIIIIIRIKVYRKDWSNNLKKAEVVYNISTGQYQSSSGLLGKTTNIQNIYRCKMINESYMVWRDGPRGSMVLALWMRCASRAFLKDLKQSRSYLSVSIGISE